MHIEMLKMSLGTEGKIPSLFSSLFPLLPSILPVFKSYAFWSQYLRSKETGNSLKSPADGGKVPFPKGTAVW